MPRRCELGCYNSKTNHQFPHPKKNPERFKAWVHIVGGKLDSPADYEVYKKKVICDIHFTDRDRNRNNRLNFLAVPSLHLPGKSNEVGTSEKVVPAPETVIEESSFATPKPTPFETVFLAPDPVIEERNLATLKPRKAAGSDDVCMSENGILVPESEHEEISLPVSESNLTAGSDNVCMSENGILVPESEHEEISLPVSESNLTAGSDDVCMSENGILVPESEHEEISLPVSESNLTARSDDVCMSEKVIHVPESEHEGSSLAVSEPTLTARSDDVCMSENIILIVPESEHEEISLAVSESNLTARFDDVCMSEEVILVSEHEESSLAVSESTLTDTGIINSEHNYYQLQKKAINENNSNLILLSNKRHKRHSDHQQQESCLWLNQLQIARRKIKILQSNLSRTQKRNEILQSKIKNYRKMSEDLLLKRVSSKMTTAAKIFTKMQYTQTEKRPSGRRFTLEEKVLSLMLYRKSPKCYPLLEKIFTLPSAKSLRRLSTKVEMETELNSSEQNS